MARRLLLPLILLLLFGVGVAQAQDFTSIGTMAGTTDKAASTSWAFPTTSTLNVGEIGVLCIATDNPDTTDHSGLNTNHTTVTDTAGNSWVNQWEIENSNGAAAGGVTTSGWVTTATAQLTSGSNITVNLSASITAKAVVGWRFSVPVWVTGIGANAANGLANDAADAGAQTLSGLDASVDHLVVRCGGTEGTGTTLTPTSGWTSMGYVATAGGAAATNMGAYGEFIIAKAASFTSDPTTSAVDQASAMWDETVSGTRPAAATRMMMGVGG